MLDTPAISVSIVSHGQGALVANLLEDLGERDWSDGEPFEVVVTLNIPEDESWLGGDFPFPITVVRNDAPKGFGANHNAAFQVARGAFFAVVNPDIRLRDFHLANLMRELKRPDVGVCAPLVKSPDGAVEDSARRFPTVRRLLLRKLLRQRAPDYDRAESPIAVDWVAGMFLLFSSRVYRAIGGFDERYFMYLEDVEICRNLHRRGLLVLWVGTTIVIHDASRASRHSLRHLRWHVASLIRYLFTRARN